MKLIPYKIEKKQLIEIHNNALKILNNIGIEVPESVISKLSGRKGVKIENKRVKLNNSIVEDFLNKYKSKSVAKKEKKQDKLILRSIGHVQYFLIPGTEEIKPISEENLIEATKLIDVLYSDGIRGCCPGRPQELPSKLQSLAQYRISCLYSRQPTIPAFFSIWEGEYLTKMYEIITGEKLNTIGIHII
ncbi:MAG: trimethylamine methyltransferase family protein, partial [Candidatus Omnitrophica bacterium]|nr:trimethylamine methyltransferase family protein [Candidatus Omnitrophota bacterium]